YLDVSFIFLYKTLYPLWVYFFIKMLHLDYKFATKKTASNQANSYALDQDFLAKFWLGLH
ncbi:hypothetical protein, partial [Ligilactobacillus aviarius]|uniref:hypothetical protein n=1 Tax=Ligilactobacillus aviarius TaxID=1606 RepID=UPI00255B7CE7